MQRLNNSLKAIFMVEMADWLECAKELQQKNCVSNYLLK